MNVQNHGSPRPRLFLPLAMAPRMGETGSRRLERRSLSNTGSLSPAELRSIVADILG